MTDDTSSDPATYTRVRTFRTSTKLHLLDVDYDDSQPGYPGPQCSSAFMLGMWDEAMASDLTCKRCIAYYEAHQ